MIRLANRIMWHGISLEFAGLTKKIFSNRNSECRLAFVIQFSTI